MPKERTACIFSDGLFADGELYFMTPAELKKLFEQQFAAAGIETPAVDAALLIFRRGNIGVGNILAEYASYRVKIAESVKVCGTDVCAFSVFVPG